MQMDEKLHLSHAWPGLKAPEVYLALFHSPSQLFLHLAAAQEQFEKFHSKV